MAFEQIGRGEREGRGDREEGDTCGGRSSENKRRGQGCAVGFVEPELATLVDEPPAGGDWVHEMKLDGYRILACIENGSARLYSRNGKEWTAKFPPIAQAAPPAGAHGVAGRRGRGAASDGRSSFQALQNALSGAGADDLHYYVFDLPYSTATTCARRSLSTASMRFKRSSVPAPARCDTARMSRARDAKNIRAGMQAPSRGHRRKRAAATYQRGRDATGQGEM